MATARMASLLNKVLIKTSLVCVELVPLPRRSWRLPAGRRFENVLEAGLLFRSAILVPVPSKAADLEKLLCAPYLTYRPRGGS